MEKRSRDSKYLGYLKMEKIFPGIANSKPSGREYSVPWDAAVQVSDPAGPDISKDPMSVLTAPVVEPRLSKPSSQSTPS